MVAQTFEAAFDQATMREMEQGAQSKNHGITRRVALAAVTRSKAELVDGFGKDEESNAA